MGSVYILPEEVYSKIAAGEVIERPASAVRELIDNSIDAGAREITVRAEHGGIKKITVADDGFGIDEDDLIPALSMHATSKIKDISDLSKILTMGFRGEALHSVKEVSKLTLTTNTDGSGANAGYRISNFGKDAGRVVRTAYKRGTRVDVEDLFYNMPGRRKFLRSELSEWNAVKKTVVLKALSRPDIIFKLYNKEELVFKTGGGGDPGKTFFELFSSEPKFEIFGPVERKGTKLSVQVYHSSADVFFNDRRYQYLFVNKRPVSVNFFYSAADAGIKNYISPGRHPLMLVYIDIDPEKIDINMHPAKKEIKFHFQNDIFMSIQSAVAEAYGRIMKNMIFDLPAGSGGSYGIYLQKELGLSGGPENYELSMPEGRAPADESGAPRQMSILGTVFDTYILIEKNESIIFLDQHAASEAILYRKKAENAEKLKGMEKLVIPAVIDSEKWNDDISQRIILLNGCDFDIEQKDGVNIAINGVPSVLAAKKDYGFIVDTVKRFLESEIPPDPSEIIENILIDMSCGEAVKKGDKLSMTEMGEIVSEYFGYGISNCPHGRPAHFEVPRDAIERSFQRKK